MTSYKTTTLSNESSTVLLRTLQGLLLDWSARCTAAHVPLHWPSLLPATGGSGCGGAVL